MKAWFLTIMFLMPGAQDDEALILTLQAPSYALCIHFAGGWKHMSTRKMIRGDNMQEVITVLSTHCAERSTEVVKNWKPGRESATSHVDPECGPACQQLNAVPLTRIWKPAQTFDELLEHIEEQGRSGNDQTKIMLRTPVRKAENLAELLELIERRKLNPHHTWRKRMDELDKRVSRE